MTVPMAHLHDGDLTALVLDGRDRLTIECRTVQGVRVGVVLAGLERLKAGNFQRGNIILDTTFVKGSTAADDADFSSALRDLIDDPGPPRPPKGQAMVDKTIAGLRGEILNSRLGLFRLTSSYGCELTAVCRSVEAIVLP